MDFDDSAFAKTEAMIYSMTPYERKNPDSLDGRRKKRIADGSGTSVQQVNQLVNQLFEMRKMMKTMNKFQGSGRAMKGMPFGR